MWDMLLLPIRSVCCYSRADQPAHVGQAGERALGQAGEICSSRPYHTGSNRPSEETRRRNSHVQNCTPESRRSSHATGRHCFWQL
jgi:hypothetical protein